MAKLILFARGGFSLHVSQGGQRILRQARPVPFLTRFKEEVQGIGLQ